MSSQISPSTTSTVETNTSIEQLASGNVRVGLGSSIRSGTRNVRNDAPRDDVRIDVSLRLEENDNQSPNNNENNDEMRDTTNRSQGIVQSQSDAESVLFSDIENGTENQTNDTNANTNMNKDLRGLLLFFYIALFRMIYVVIFVDDGKTCTQPLRTYSYLSFVFIIYTHNYKRLKQFTFKLFISLLRLCRGNAMGVSPANNSDDNDENNITGSNGNQNEGNSSQQQQRQIMEDRNANCVFIYDRFFILLCAYYVFFGMQLTTACVTPHPCNEDPTISCFSQCGCPELYSVVKNYVVTLCVHIVILLVVVFIMTSSCVNAWIDRHTTASRGTVNQELDRDTTASRETVNEVLERMEEVKLNDIQGARGNLLENENTYKNAKECCICMMEFDSSESAEKIIIRTKCGHLFHRECLGGWLGRNWNVTSHNQSRNRSYNAPANQTVCPLCREDLTPESSLPSSNP